LGSDLRYGVFATLSLAERMDPDGANPLVVAPRMFGNARVSYSLGEKLPTIALASHYMGKRIADHGIDGHFSPTPSAPAQLELRATVTGAVPIFRGLKYRALVNYAVADRGPYVVGPTTASTPTQPGAELNPVDQLRATVGLQYDF